MVLERTSAKVYGVSSRSKPSRTSDQFMATAAKYQIAISARTTVMSGAFRATSGWLQKGAERRRGRASALLVIGVPRPQPGANPLRYLEEFRRFPDLDRPVGREVAVDDVDDAARAWRHHHDLAGEEYGLGDRVGDEQN